MTIGFSTHWPKNMGPEFAGKPNYFVPKVWTGLMKYGVQMNAVQWAEIGNSLPKEDSDKIFNVQPKIHTFREDSQDRWKVGMKIHPVINNRTKNRFQFAPIFKVTRIQKIEIIHSKSNPGIVRIIIDKKPFYEGPTWSCYKRHLENLVRNDGFESVEQFFAWFNKDFTGKIIHWTNFKY